MARSSQMLNTSDRDEGVANPNRNTGVVVRAAKWIGRAIIAFLEASLLLEAFRALVPKWVRRLPSQTAETTQATVFDLQLRANTTVFHTQRSLERYPIRHRIRDRLAAIGRAITSILSGIANGFRALLRAHNAMWRAAGRAVMAVIKFVFRVCSAIIGAIFAFVTFPFRWTGRFLRRHPVWGSLAAFLMLLAVGAAVAAYVIGEPYWDKSGEFDLAAVERLSVGALVLDDEGRRLGRVGAVNRKLSRFEDYPPHLIGALLAAEDQRFYDHIGFDIVGIARAAIANYHAGGVEQGASTITQQLARDVFKLGGRSYERKLLEIFVSWRIEQAYEKEEIIEHYLNRIYFGSGHYGIGAAAKGYFGKALKDLDLGECALLCGLIRSPNRFSPRNHPDAAIAARNETLRRMNESGALSFANYEDWLGRTTAATDHEEVDPQSRYILARIGAEAQQLLGARASLDGLSVETSVDADLQRKAEREIGQHLASLDGRVTSEQELQGSIIIIENQTGRVLAAIGTRDFIKSQFDRVWRSRRPAGSAFFPLLYAAAFDRAGITPLTPVLDTPVDNREVMLGGTTGILGEWSTETADNRWEGRITAGRALATSKNSVAVRVGFDTGLDVVAEVAKQAGVESPLRKYSSAFLGASEVSLAEMTRAYTIFPNQGTPAPAPGLIDQITAHNGEVVYKRPVAMPAPAIAEHAATEVTSLLASSHGEGTKTAGKSGTACAYTDNWFIGFNSNYTWGVWIGFDRTDTIYPQAFGRETAQPLWARFVDDLPSDSPLLAPSRVQPLRAMVIGKPKEVFSDAPKPLLPPLVGADPYGSLKPEMHDSPIAEPEGDPPEAEPAALTILDR